MKKIIILLAFAFCIKSYSQTSVNDTGAWYMYFYDHQFKNSQFGIQGDLQYRNWNFIGDLEQLLIRSGFTYRPKETNVKLTLGYAHITTGVIGDSDDTSAESRIYQEAFLPQKVGNRLLFAHRFRYEQRFVDGQDFRTRYRYNLFLNVPLNKPTMEKDAFHLALYNELFINGQTDIGDGREVQLFDRNRTYLGLGYVIRKGLRVQLGWMNQKVVSTAKAQWQFSLHHNF